MNKCSGYCHDAFYVYHHTAVVAQTDKLAHGSFENSARDAYFGSFHQLQLFRLHVDEGLVVRACNQYEAAHLRIRNNNRLMGLTVHDIAYRYVQNRIVFDFIDTGTGGTEKYQVVYGGNELADAAFVPYDILVAHGDEILYIFLVEIVLQGQFAAVCYANGIPVQLAILVGLTHRGVLQFCLIIV